MKKSTTRHRMLQIVILPLLVACLALAAPAVRAQDDGYPVPPETFSREELTQLLAPIALYPDPLLSQILMASTYPLEVIQADRWLTRNPGLQGDALDTALLEEDWDPSVKAICHFPDILALMSEQIGQTTDLGNAFLAQEGEVMDVVQELRAKAYAQGNLSSNSQQRVEVVNQTIIVEPANPQVVYVPYYDPLYIYGPWWYPGYPPYYWWPPGAYVGAGIYYWPAFYFGYSFGSWCYFDWPHHYVFINAHQRPRYVRYDHWHGQPGRWHHAPQHRRGVAYRDRTTARRYGQAPPRGSDYRRDVRGFPERGMTVRERDFTGHERNGTNRNWTRGRSTAERGRQQQLNRQQPPPSSGQQPPREEGVNRNRQQQNAPPQGQLRDRADRDRQQPAAQPRQRGERSEPTRLQQRFDHQRQPAEPAARDRQQRQATGGQGEQRQRIEREVEQRIRDNVFNQINEGRNEHRFSERGRTSRQGGEGSSPGTGRSGGTNLQRRFEGGRR